MAEALMGVTDVQVKNPTAPKVVFISCVPLTERTRRVWTIEHLVENGMTVEYWDATKLWQPRLEKAETLVDPHRVAMDTWQALESRLDTTDNARTTYILLMNYEARFQKLFRLMTKRRCRIATFQWGDLPFHPPNKLQKLLRALTRPSQGARRIRDKVVTVLSRRLGLVKPFDLVFAAGRAAVAAQPAAGKIVPINYYDYDNFQSAAPDSRLMQGHYGVFIDNDQAHHPDLRFLGVRYIDPERYFASLNRFFALVEEKFKAPIVIAAHPTSSYQLDRFAGRKILKNATLTLVKDAEFVLCHTSTAVSYAVLASKPLLFIYTDEMAEAYQDTYFGYQRGFAEYLQMPLLNIDKIRSKNDFQLLSVDPQRYESYRYDFLTSPQSERKRTSDIVLRTLTSDVL